MNVVSISLLASLASLGHGLSIADIDTTWKDGTTQYELKGYRPRISGKKLPVALIFPGNKDQWDAGVWLTLAVQMAHRGFAAIVVEYGNQEGFILTGNALCEDAGKMEQAEALFKGSSSALETACYLAETDCSLGVALMGFSLGAYMAAYGAQLSDKVTALLLMAPLDAECCTNDEMLTKHLPRSKRRVLSGYSDYVTGLGEKNELTDIQTKNAKTAKAIAGYDCAIMQADCLQDDGSGYYLVSNTDFVNTTCEVGSIGHMFFYSDGTPNAYVTGGTQLLCDFMNVNEWGLIGSLNWLAKAAQADGAKQYDAPLILDREQAIQCRNECPQICPGKEFVGTLAALQAAMAMGAIMAIIVSMCCCVCIVAGVGYFLYRRKQKAAN